MNATAAAKTAALLATALAMQTAIPTAAGATLYLSTPFPAASGASAKASRLR